MKKLALRRPVPQISVFRDALRQCSGFFAIVRNRTKGVRVRTTSWSWTMAVDQTALRHIGKLMHQHFDAIVSEPLPPRLHELVERLKVEPEAARSQSAARPERSPEGLIRLPTLRTASA